MSRFFKGLSWSPAFCFLFVAIMEMYSGNPSGGTTWLVLGVCNAAAISKTKDGFAVASVGLSGYAEGMTAKGLRRGNAILVTHRVHGRKGEYGI